MKEKQCKNYVGVACVNGSCPIAMSEEYEERCIPVVKKCTDCFYYKGCEDCGLHNTEYCDGQLNGNLGGNMKRLTEVDGKGNWHIAGIEWGNIKGNLYGALCKLKDYEDTGLSPVEVAELNTFDGSQAIKATAKLQEEQSKHSWVPVSERLPEEKINPITDDYAEYNVTFCCNGKCDTRHYKFGDGHWWNSGTCMDEYVIAWMPLPEPYKAD